MLFIIPSILIMFIAIINYKTGFLMYLLLQMVWFPDTQILNIGGSWININFVCALYFAMLYCLRKKTVGKEFEKFPYYCPMICIGISLLLTSFTSYSGLIGELVKAFGLIIMDLVIVYIIWKTVNKKEDFEFLFKGITIIVLFACIYIFYEKITQLNPILDYKITCTSNKFSTYRDFQQWDYRGYRCYSIFDHTICASMTFALYAAITLNLFVKNIRYPYKLLSSITAVMCLPAMFFTQQRTGLVFLFISALSIVDLKKKKFWELIVLGLVVIVIVSPLLSNSINLLLSIFSSKAAIQVSGSSVSMRFDQLDAVFRIMLEAPLTGLGEKFQAYYTGTYASRAMGYESLWFEQMAKHGLCGVLAYVIMIYYSMYKIPKKYKSKTAFFFSMAYWLVYTMTSTNYFRIYFLYTTIFYFIKNSELYRTQIKNNAVLQKNMLTRNRAYHLDVLEVKNARISY